MERHCSQIKVTGATLVCHPTGNANVRAVLSALVETNALARFVTSFAWQPGDPLETIFPRRIVKELRRRSYGMVPSNLVSTSPAWELIRLFSSRLGFGRHVESLLPQTMIKSIGRSVDLLASRVLVPSGAQNAYCYEGVAVQTFRTAKASGLRRLYELPSGYWHEEIACLRQEAELEPEYAPTLTKLSDPKWYLDQCDEEIDLSSAMVVPSTYVLRTLQKWNRLTKPITVAPFGCPNSRHCRQSLPLSGRKLRIIFVGALTQRKGLSYLFDAMDKLKGGVSLTLIGGRVNECRKMEQQVQKHRWIPSAAHADVLREIADHDVLVLPSLAEGFGLVIGEAMACGVPVIATENTGGPDIIRHGKDGFIVPIRSADSIAGSFASLLDSPGDLEEMSANARLRAAEVSWENYKKKIVDVSSGVI